MILRTIGVVVLAWCTCTFAGCATADPQASLSYKPVANVVGGSGVIFLTMNSSQWNVPRKTIRSRYMPRFVPERVMPKPKKLAPQGITYVEVKNDTGLTIGKIVMPVYSGDLIIDSIKKELTSAGYTVRLLQNFPKDVEKGVDITWISTELEQNSWLLFLEGTCHLNIKVDVWRNGSKVDSHDYSSNVSDYSFSDQHLPLAEQLLMKATQIVTKQAVPDIIHEINRPLR